MPGDRGGRDSGAPVWAKYLSGGTVSALSAKPVAQGWSRGSGSSSLPPPAGSVEGCPLPYDWETRAYLALDFETTGLDARTGRIVEAGALQFRLDGEGAIVIEREWSSLVNPGMPIPDEATAVHGITDLDVSAAPFFREIAPGLLALATGRVIVAHNAAFDLGFLRAELDRCGAASPDCDVADSLGLARAAFPSFMRFNLGMLAYRLGIDTGSSHRALDDARTCMRIFVASARALAEACP